MTDLFKFYDAETKTLNIPYKFNEKLINIPEETTKIFLQIPD